MGILDEVWRGLHKRGADALNCLLYEVTMKQKSVKVTLDWKYLQRIAEYYEFPSAIFLGPEACLDKQPKTRNISLEKKAEAFDMIKDIVEEF